MQILSSIALLLSSVLTCLWLLQQHKGLESEAHHLVRVFAVSSLFLAADAMGNMLLSSEGTDQATLRLMLNNLALYAALPLIATTLLAMAKGWHWSMAGWGRWLLGLIAFFELTRRMEYGNYYTQLMLLLVVAAIGFGSLLAPQLKAKAAGSSAALLLLLLALFASPAPLLSASAQPAIQYLLLAISLPLMAVTLHWQLKMAPAQ
ncbi:hypothetical protein [Nitrincola alkalilacustris]|uniref:hypothetical protein n=1 Tax=Nitrincola alkalilacustris TaxID=1571224 RepID=UPI00124D556F|nr:hypothetical protein [Nitrincola alkalilacustris]